MRTTTGFFANVDAMRILRSYEPEETMDIEIIRRGHHEVITASVPEHRVRILDEWTVRE